MAQRLGCEPETNAPTRPWRIVVGVGLTVILVVATAWWWLSRGRHETFDPAPGVRVEHRIDGVPTGLKIGVVVSYTEDASQGAGWDANGEGITVAKWRLEQGGSPVETVVVSDQGSDTGSVAAVKELTDAHVSAIIALTRGSHATELAAAAARAGLPIVFPYQNAPETPPQGAWYGLETPERLSGHLAQQLTELGCSPLLAEEPVPAELGADGSFTDETPADEIKAMLGESDQGCIMLNGPAAKLADRVQSLLAQEIAVPIIVGPDGANNEFISSIRDINPVGATVYGFGTPSRFDGAPWVGFEQARTLAAGPGDIPSLQDGTVFSQRSELADTSSYEAFMALVVATARAGSVEPSAIGESLARVQIPASQATDGIERDFTSPVYQKLGLVQIVQVGSSWQWARAN